MPRMDKVHRSMESREAWLVQRQELSRISAIEIVAAVAETLIREDDHRIISLPQWYESVGVSG
jgi:hypothetical protein